VSPSVEESIPASNRRRCFVGVRGALFSFRPGEPIARLGDRPWSPRRMPFRGVGMSQPRRSRSRPRSVISGARDCGIGCWLINLIRDAKVDARTTPRPRPTPEGRRTASCPVHGTRGCFKFAGVLSRFCAASRKGTTWKRWGVLSRTATRVFIMSEAERGQALPGESGRGPDGLGVDGTQRGRGEFGTVG
jgi:hypothetical protein